MGNISKRQQPDQKKKKSAGDHQWIFNTARKSRTQRHALFPSSKTMYQFSDIKRHTKLRNSKESKVKNQKSYKTNKGQSLQTWEGRKNVAALNMFFEISTLPIYL